MEGRAPRDGGSFLGARGSPAGIVGGKSGRQQPYLGSESTHLTLEKLTSWPGKLISWGRSPSGRRVTSRGLQVTVPRGDAIFPRRGVARRCGEGSVPDLQRAGLALQRPHLVLQQGHLDLQQGHLDLRRARLDVLRGYLAVGGRPRPPGISPSRQGNVARSWRRRPRGEGAAPVDRGVSPRGAGTWLEGRGGLPTAGEAGLIARCSSPGAR